MMPNQKTIFKPISELVNYTDSVKWFCNSVVFSPETENDHFSGCPPYISITATDDFDDEHFFEVPKIVAYYAVTHTGYTMKGLENHRKQGERDLAAKIKQLLDIK